MIFMRFYNFILLILILSAKIGVSATADANNSPYDVVYNHTHFLKNTSYDELKSANSFNIPNRKKRIEAAKDLYEILYGKGIDLNALVRKTPDNPSYIDSASFRAIYILDKHLPEVFVEKVGNHWYYSQATIDVLPSLHKKIFPFGTNFWANWFPFHANEKYLKLHPWQWIGIGIISVAFLFAFFLLRFFFHFIFNKFLFKKYANEIQDVDKLKSISKLFSIWIGFIVLQTFIPTLFISPKYSIALINGVNFIAASILVIVIYKLVELFIFYVLKYKNDSSEQWNEQVISVAQKFIKFTVVFVGLFYVLNTLGVNFATIIAGLSVGGLALALAAQDTVKNFISSVMIFIDKPFKLGDTIKSDSVEGVVQEVGFRSTRIKTADESLIYISNAKLLEMIIDNKGYRVFKKFKTEILLPYHTPLHIVEQFIEGIKTILLKYPYTKNSTIDVHLSNIKETGISITISYTYKVYNQREELNHREFILLKILSLAELLHIKLFENKNQIITTNPEPDEVLNVDDVSHKLDKFFVQFDDQVSKVK
jgi:MscS family membrane protein